MQILDNVNDTVRDDLKKTLKKGSKVSVIVACCQRENTEGKQGILYTQT